LVERVAGAVGMGDTLAWEETSKVVVDMSLVAEAGSADEVLVEPGVVVSGSALASQALATEKEMTPVAEVTSSFLI
jgi:hypothetical protein